MKNDFRGKVSLVTGSSRGIGKSISLELASHGSEIIVNYLKNDDDAERTLDLIRQFGIEPFKFRADIRRRHEVDLMVSGALEKFGRIDFLINNCGIVMDRTLQRMSDSEWDSVIETNLSGVYNVTRAVLPHMVKNNFGRIVNIASVVGQAGNIGQTNYAASKGGVIAFTKALALEVAGRGITVNAVSPGFIDTDMTRFLGKEVKDNILSKIPLRRFGDPKEVASAVSFLVSQDASYITGQILNVNGGLYV